jgi:hypothetical protein
VSQTSRSSFPKPARWNKPDAAELFNMLRLVLCHSRAPILLRSEAVRADAPLGNRQKNGNDFKKI